MSHQVGTQLGSLPIQVVFDSSGQIGFARMANFQTVIENLEDGLSIIYSNDDIYLAENTQLMYNVLYQYKNIPEMITWLKSQNLQMPQFN